MIRFETVLKAAVVLPRGNATVCMHLLGAQFDFLPLLTLAEALVVTGRMTMAEYREIERVGFDFGDTP